MSVKRMEMLNGENDLMPSELVEQDKSDQRDVEEFTLDQDYAEIETTKLQFSENSMLCENIDELEAIVLPANKLQKSYFESGEEPQQSIDNDAVNKLGQSYDESQSNIIMGELECTSAEHHFALPEQISHDRCTKKRDNSAESAFELQQSTIDTNPYGDCDVAKTEKDELNVDDELLPDKLILEQPQEGVSASDPSRAPQNGMEECNGEDKSTENNENRSDENDQHGLVTGLSEYALVFGSQCEPTANSRNSHCEPTITPEYMHANSSNIMEIQDKIINNLENCNLYEAIPEHAQYDNVEVAEQSLEVNSAALILEIGTNSIQSTEATTFHKQHGDFEDNVELPSKDIIQRDLPPSIPLITPETSINPSTNKTEIELTSEDYNRQYEHTPVLLDPTVENSQSEYHSATLEDNYSGCDNVTAMSPEMQDSKIAVVTIPENDQFELTAPVLATDGSINCESMNSIPLGTPGANNQLDSSIREPTTSKDINAHNQVIMTPAEVTKDIANCTPDMTTPPQPENSTDGESVPAKREEPHEVTIDWKPELDVTTPTEPHDSESVMTTPAQVSEDITHCELDMNTMVSKLEESNELPMTTPPQAAELTAVFGPDMTTTPLKVENDNESVMTTTAKENLADCESDMTTPPPKPEDDNELLMTTPAQDDITNCAAGMTIPPKMEDNTGCELIVTQTEEPHEIIVDCGPDMTTPANAQEVIIDSEPKVTTSPKLEDDTESVMAKPTAKANSHNISSSSTTDKFTTADKSDDQSPSASEKKERSTSWKNVDSEMDEVTEKFSNGLINSTQLTKMMTQIITKKTPKGKVAERWQKKMSVGMTASTPDQMSTPRIVRNRNKPDGGSNSLAKLHTTDSGINQPTRSQPDMHQEILQPSDKSSGKETSTLKRVRITLPEQQVETKEDQDIVSENTTADAEKEMSSLLKGKVTAMRSIFESAASQGETKQCKDDK